MPRWTDDPAATQPMLAALVDAPLDDVSLAYEPKYDGIRALVSIEPRPGPPMVRIWSRLGNEKTAQFPEIAEAVAQWARPLKRPLLLDGEIVALDEHGEPCGFQNLQSRIHLKAETRTARAAAKRDATRSALVAFDLLRDGEEDLRPLPLRERRTRLETVLDGATNSTLRISEHVAGDGRGLQERARRRGWEGVVAKRLDSRYLSGRRSPDWRKLKLVRHQTCVVGGWTDPRGTRPFFGALLLGVYGESGRLEYVGHTGAGFSDAELGRVWKQLQALKTKTSPFDPQPKTNERPHWTRPELVVEVKFTEWTDEGRLRHPTYLGVRDDVAPKSTRKEHVRKHQRAAVSTVTTARAADKPMRQAPSAAALRKLLDQLEAIEAGSGNGVLDLPGRERLDVTNLAKVFWPARRKSKALTKGDLFRHYVRVAPFILPALAERPLVMKRYPNGISGQPFYQHRAGGTLPSGVRVETVSTGSEERPHLIGGDLKTLLYTVQLASISQDPWFSRAGTLDIIDHVAIDLDPPDGLPFDKVLDVARWVRDELAILKAPGFPKTSGSGGLHIYVPMPPGTTYDAGLIFCQIVATMVAKKHPQQATIERSLKARGRRIYVDYMQNARGKTLASVYSARANEFAGVSTPLTWDEVDEGVTPQDFTIPSFAGRLEAVGDLWAALRKSKGANLRAVMQYAEP